MSHAWFFHGILMFGPPVIGALVVRGGPCQWQRWIAWVFSCVMSYGIMHGAGWQPSDASWAISIASLFGLFASEIIPAVGGTITRNVLRFGIVIALVVFGLQYFTHLPEPQQQNILQWGVVCALGAAWIFASLRRRNGGGHR